MKFSFRALKWLAPGMKIKRWIFLSWIGLTLFTLGFVLVANVRIPIDIEIGVVNVLKELTGKKVSSKLVDIFFIVLGLGLMIIGIRQWFSSIYRVIVPFEQKKLVEVLYEKRQLGHGLKVVAIGGGTGLSTLLRGLKERTTNNVAVVTVSDDGGSSGRLRTELGVLPPGDIRNCIVALASDESLLSSLFQYRFSNGDGLQGHNFGNLFLAALTGVAGDFDKAVRLSSEILAIRGKVFPATLRPTVLCAEFDDGSVVEGESQIPQAGKKIRRIFLKPGDCQPLDEVLHAIKEADAIVLGPGSLFTSVIPNLLVKGVVEAIRQSRAVKIYVCNVMTQPGETDGFSASDHLRAFFSHAEENIVDYALINDEVPKKLLQKYQEQGAHPVVPDVEEVERLGVKAVSANLINETDLVRHDPKKLADAICRLVVEASEEEQEIKKSGERWRKFAGLLDERF